MFEAETRDLQSLIWLPSSLLQKRFADARIAPRSSPISVSPRSCRMSASPPSPAYLRSLSPVLTAVVHAVGPPAGLGGPQGQALSNWSHCPITPIPFLPRIRPAHPGRQRPWGAEETVRSPGGVTLNGKGRGELDSRTRGLLSWSCGPGVPGVDRRHGPRRWEGEAFLSPCLSHQPPLPSGPTPEEGGQAQDPRLERPVAPPSKADPEPSRGRASGAAGASGPADPSCTADRLTFLTPAWHFSP